MPKQSKKQSAQPSKPSEASHFLPVDKARLLRCGTEIEVIELSKPSAQRLAAAAQFLGLSDKEELAQIVINAFLEMYDEDHFITFPIMFQQVDTLD